MHLTRKFFFVQINLCTCLKRTAPFCPVLTRIMTFYRLWKLGNLANICCTTEQVRGMGLFLGGRHRLICIVLSLCKHACKSVCDVHPGIDPYLLLARSCNRWWPDFVTFTACKKSRFGLKRGKKAQCVPNRCKDIFERKNYFGVRCTLITGIRLHFPSILTSFTYRVTITIRHVRSPSWMKKLVTF